jgi:hypothetical protein
LRAQASAKLADRLASVLARTVDATDIHEACHQTESLRSLIHRLILITPARLRATFSRRMERDFVAIDGDSRWFGAFRLP